MIRAAPLAALLLLTPTAAPAAEWFADVEVGAVAATRNDVRVPGSGGTTLSLVDDLEPRPGPYARVRLGAAFAGRHAAFATWAPLRLASRGVLPNDVLFHGVAFPAGAPVTAGWVQDSYRATYRYGVVRSERLDVDLGATASLRDSAVALQGTWWAQKTTLDVLPLLSFRVAWRFSPPFALVVDGDAIAWPQGRAEDVLVGVQAELRPGLAVRAGYRLIEGVTDTAELYDAYWLNHLGLALEARL